MSIPIKRTTKSSHRTAADPHNRINRRAAMTSWTIQSRSQYPLCSIWKMILQNRNLVASSCEPYQQLQTRFFDSKNLSTVAICSTSSLASAEEH